MLERFWFSVILPLQTQCKDKRTQWNHKTHTERAHRKRTYVRTLFTFSRRQFQRQAQMQRDHLKHFLHWVWREKPQFSHRQKRSNICQPTIVHGLPNRVPPPRTFFTLFRSQRSFWSAPRQRFRGLKAQKTNKDMSRVKHSSLPN